MGGMIDRIKRQEERGWSMAKDRERKEKEKLLTCSVNTAEQGSTSSSQDKRGGECR